MTDRLGAKPVPIQIPMMVGEQFQGIIDLIEMKAITYDEDEPGRDLRSRHEIPRDLAEEPRPRRRHHLLESIAEYDEQLLDDYLHEKPYTADDLRRALRKGTLPGQDHARCCAARRSRTRACSAARRGRRLPALARSTCRRCRGTNPETFEHVQRAGRRTTSRSRRSRSRS